VPTSSRFILEERSDHLMMQSGSSKTPPEALE
jgi:hypothetical protein